MSFMLFHWSPVERRKQIIRHGLRTCCRPRQDPGCGWKAPYISFCKSPSMAWGASAEFSEEPAEFDLWMVWNDRLEGWEIIHLLTTVEYRVYHNIPKRNIWHVGTRTFVPRAKPITSLKKGQ